MIDMAPTSYLPQRQSRTSPEVKEFQWFLKGRRPPPPPYLPLCYDLILMKMRVGVRRGGVRKLGSWRVGKLGSWIVGKLERWRLGSLKLEVGT